MCEAASILWKYYANAKWWCCPLNNVWCWPDFEILKSDIQYELHWVALCVLIYMNVFASYRLLRKVSKELAGCYFQDGCVVMAACCHLAIENIEVKNFLFVQNRNSGHLLLILHNSVHTLLHVVQCFFVSINLADVSFGWYTSTSGVE